MKRKDFLALIAPVAGITSAFSKPKNVSQKSHKIPPFLKKGDTIGIACPSGFITANECQSAINKMQEWGFRVKIGNTVGAKDFTFAGSDQERREDLQKMLDDPEIAAIMLGRGGYGAVRIIDRIDFSGFARNPKWIIGFSDATIFHLHINRNFGIPTIHSKMCNSFPDDFGTADDIQLKTIDSIRQCLVGDKMNYTADPHQHNREGTAQGVLIGGNLSLIDNVCGSVSDVNTDGKILFLEDVGEYPYKIDSMLWNLKRSGKFSKLKGLLIGSFRMKTDDEDSKFGKDIAQMVLEKVKDFDYPVCFDFPVGHVRANYALICGLPHQLKVSAENVFLSATSG